MKKFLIGFLILGLIGWAYEIITGEKISSEPPKVEKKNESPVKFETPNYKGRGQDGRDEPRYVGLKGYVAVYHNELDGLIKNLNYTNVPWQVPTYQRDKQFFYKTDQTIDHKTPIIIKEQFLKHEGYNNYSGYLLAERLTDNQQFFIDVENFIIRPYWENQNPVEAVKGGYVIGTYHQTSGYYPVASNNTKVTLPEGTNLLIKGLTGTFGKGGVDSNTHPLEVQLTSQGHTAYFNQADLTVSY